jgi:hypothetical protein
MPQLVLSSISPFHWSKRANGAIMRVVLQAGSVEGFFNMVAILESRSAKAKT